MNLLLDLGNTRIKWMCTGIDARAGETVEARAWDSDLAAALTQVWQGMPTPRRVVAASVVDAQREQILDALVSARFGVAVQWLRTPAAAGGVRNAYAEPWRLGVDRFLSMLAAFTDGKAPSITVSCGTALTLDALTADGRHLGGLIAPGPPLMQQAVLGATAQVSAGASGRVVDVADNTADALASGCWHAADALIERFAARMRNALGGAPCLLLDGGDAERMLGLLQSPAQWYPHAVLRGLAAWADEHA